MSNMDFTRIRQLSDTFQRAKKLNDNFIPQVVSKNVSLFIGVLDGEFAVIIKGEYEDLLIKNTNLIDVLRVTLEKGEGLAFVLKDSNLLDIFISFVADLENIINENENASIREIYNRYLYWQNMFKVENNIQSEALIKGLINELNILNKLLIPKYGVNEALLGWTGSEKMHKDFYYHDYWYEVKAVNIGKETVEISSLEQLDSKSNGQLLVSYFERTSSENNHGINLYDLFKDMSKHFEYDNQLAEIYAKISKLGIDLRTFTDEKNEINQYRYIIHGIDSFLVNDDFPRLNKDILFDSISKIKYQLILSKIEDYKISFQ